MVLLLSRHMVLFLRSKGYKKTLLSPKIFLLRDKSVQQNSFCGTTQIDGEQPPAQQRTNMRLSHGNGGMPSATTGKNAFRSALSGPFIVPLPLARTGRQFSVRRMEYDYSSGSLVCALECGNYRPVFLICQGFLKKIKMGPPAEAPEGSKLPLYRWLSSAASSKIRSSTSGSSAVPLVSYKYS